MITSATPSLALEDHARLLRPSGLGRSMAGMDQANYHITVRQPCRTSLDHPERHHAMKYRTVQHAGLVTGRTVFTVECMPSDQDHWAYGVWDPCSSFFSLGEAIEYIAQHKASIEVQS